MRIQNIKSSGEVIAYSQEMLDVLDLVYHVASSDSTILLLGEYRSWGKRSLAKCYMKTAFVLKKDYS
ncbi:hypothetical protein RCO48_31190 [Peribacillus frigoritolerans]|nr:hypothetical protein [Peribacillus frigoritolerans]